MALCLRKCVHVSRLKNFLQIIFFATLMWSLNKAIFWLDCQKIYKETQGVCPSHYSLWWGCPVCFAHEASCALGWMWSLAFFAFGAHVYFCHPQYSSLTLSWGLLVVTTSFCLPAGSTYWFATSSSRGNNQKNGGFKKKSPQEDEGMYVPKRYLMKQTVCVWGVRVDSMEDPL